ncbi:DUF3048 domain-containing protein [Brevibacillus fluminis]|nr:DUF3048 domain-containing protein [Brevibacillus fluminis]
MSKRLNRTALSIMMLILLTACAQETTVPPAQTEPPAPTPTPQPVTQQPSPEQPTYSYTAPLTGMGTNEPVDHRPIMVMVNNAPPARPQSGLDKADIVYELLAEGEMTRFVAIYQSQKPKVIGPVRSIRPYFIQLGAGFDAVMIHAGGSPEALETLAHSTTYNSVNEISNGKYFWREKFRKMPHNLYTDLDRIDKAIADKGMRDRSELPFLPFLPADTVITDGAKAETIQVTYHSLNKASYTYDPESKKYLRFTAGKPHTDLVTKQQLSVTNLLVIAARHKILDSEGRREVDINGPGDGYLFQQGKVQPVIWKRVNGVIRAYSVTDQKELPLLPGNTWVNILPDKPGLAKELSFQ